MKKLILLCSVVGLLFIISACSGEETSEFNPPKEITAENTSLFADNGKNGLMYSKLLKGSVENYQKAVILSDESCEMDDKGITHCFNNIRLENGKEIRVNTLHVMKDVRCLKPEEEVTISSYENGYVQIKRG